MDKDKTAKAIQEARELVDEVMPLESSVVKDQILLTLISLFIQHAMANKFPEPPLIATSSPDGTTARH
jgi:uncharacterized protein YjgD (DUF1641 family)